MVYLNQKSQFLYIIMLSEVCYKHFYFIRKMVLHSQYTKKNSDSL